MNEQTRSAEEEIDPATEATILERLKTVDEDKKTAAPWSEVKKRILSQPVPQ